jgi:hypothetical protein
MMSYKARITTGFATLVIAIAGFAVPGVFAPPEDLRITMNIPASRLDVFEHGVRTHSYAISAGRREFATPPGKYRISEVIWNPWWHPPKSEWARNEKPTPPGPGNPMGRVKINFANLYYIHGTPYEEDLGIPASHGCIRIGDRDLIELAQIIHRYRTPRVDERIINTLIDNRTMTRSFHVKPVSFTVQYKLVEVLDNKLIIHPNVYRTAGTDLRKEIVAALKSEGVQISSKIEQRLPQWSKTRNATRLTIALDTLTAGPAGD